MEAGPDTRAPGSSQHPYCASLWFRARRRVEIPAHDALLGELLALERDARTGRVDHPPHGSKDLADALAGVVYGLTMRCDVWWQHEVNPFEEAPEIAARLTLYGRRNRASEIVQARYAASR